MSLTHLYSVSLCRLHCIVLFIVCAFFCLYVICMLYEQVRKYHFHFDIIFQPFRKRWLVIVIVDVRTEIFTVLELGY